MSELDMYTLPAAVSLILIAVGMFLQNKNIVYEDRRLHPDQFRLWSQIILIVPYVFILPTAARQFTDPFKTPDGLLEAWAVAVGTFVIFLSSLLRFLKYRKKKGN